MEKYNSKNALYPETDNVWYPNPDDPELVGSVEYPHIIFDKEDGKCGMKVSLEEIVDVWLERLEPEQQQKLELEETTRSEKRELATLRKEKERREEDEKRKKVELELKGKGEKKVKEEEKQKLGLEKAVPKKKSFFGKIFGKKEACLLF